MIRGGNCPHRQEVPHRQGGAPFLFLTRVAPSSIESQGDDGKALSQAGRDHENLLRVCRHLGESLALFADQFLPGRLIGFAQYQGRFAAADELIAPDYINRDANPGQGAGPNGVIHVARLYRTAFPDLKLSIERMISEGDCVAVHVREEGTHLGPFEGIAPTGRRVVWDWIGIYRVAGGKLVERWGRIDTQLLYEQLGCRLLKTGL